MMKRILLLGAALLLGMLVVGCGSTQPPQPAVNEKGAVKVESPISQRFLLAGSGTNLPITEKLAEAYKKKPARRSRWRRASAPTAPSRL